MAYALGKCMALLAASLLFARTGNLFDWNFGNFLVFGFSANLRKNFLCLCFFSKEYLSAQ